MLVLQVRALVTRIVFEFGDLVVDWWIFVALGEMHLVPVHCRKPLQVPGVWVVDRLRR